MGFPNSSGGKEATCNEGDPGWIPGLGRSCGKGIGYLLQYSWASQEAQMVKNLPAMWETRVGTILWRRKWQSTRVFLPGESAWTEEPASIGSQRETPQLREQAQHRYTHIYLKCIESYRFFVDWATFSFFHFGFFNLTMITSDSNDTPFHSCLFFFLI